MHGKRLMQTIRICILKAAYAQNGQIARGAG
jgi:hypothetical protein